MTHGVPATNAIRATSNRNLQPSPSVKVGETQDGVVLLDVEGGLIFPLDQVSTLIWKGIQVGTQTEDIAQQIADIFGIPLEQASSDIGEFVDQLLAQHLLVTPGIPKERTSRSLTGGFRSFLSRVISR